MSLEGNVNSEWHINSGRYHVHHSIQGSQTILKVAPRFLSLILTAPLNHQLLLSLRLYAPWYRHHGNFTINEGPMQEFQYQQIPEVLCIISFPTAMSIKQLGNYLWSKIAPLRGTRSEEDVVRDLS